MKVFGTFLCGGGSTMGYKLAGYDHLGGVELDSSIASMYVTNHHPRYMFNEDIRSFLQRQDLPHELFNLDLLDGSPPCSTFSLSGNREDDWGKEKAFREGQAVQRLDDLFFDYISLVNRLKPKVAVSENVTGLIQGNAKAYVHDIIKEFERIGYQVQLFKLNAASMGVPQARERVFFICCRQDMPFARLRLIFNERPIRFGEVEQQVTHALGEPLTDAFAKWWNLTKPGYRFSDAHPEGSFFNSCKVAKHRVCPTITATEGSKISHYSKPVEISDECLKLCSSWPLDYDFRGMSCRYVVGMSVPPVMMAQIAHQIAAQWLCVPKK
jgi:DNA (cytosine-5)-methyltransferase 1